MADTRVRPEKPLPMTAPLTPQMLSGRSKGPRTWILRTHSILVYLFLFAPIVLLVVYAFNDGRGGQWQGFTVGWFRQVFLEESRDSREIFEAIQATFLVALVATAISIVLGTLAAYALSRYRILGRAAYDGLFFIPLVIPEIVQAVSLLAFVQGTIPIGQGFAAVILGHVSFSVSFALIVVRARMANFDARLEEASSDLGATPWTTFWRVTFPLALPGIVAGGLLAFTLSFDDLAITLMVTDPNLTTLPLWVYGKMKFGLNPQVNVVAVFMIFVSVGILAIALIIAKLTSRGGKTELPITVG